MEGQPENSLLIIWEEKKKTNFSTAERFWDLHL